jgi:hypothetical protein
LTHAEFITAYRAGRIKVAFDPPRAAKYLSARLLLPLFMLPVLGAGVALALLGWLWSGLAVIALGIIAPRLIKRSAPHFLLTQALEDETVFNELTHAHILLLTDTHAIPAPPHRSS